MKVIQPTVVISPSSIPNAIIGVPYSQRISAGTGGQAVTWSELTPLPVGFNIVPVPGLPSEADIVCANPQVPFDATVIILATSADGQIGIANY